MRVAALVALAALAGCPARGGKKPITVEPSAATTGSLLVLYTDKAFLTFRDGATFDDSGVALLSNVPVGERTEVRVVGGPALASEHALRATDYRQLTSLKNKKVVAITEDARIAGRVIEWDYRGLSLATDNGIAVITDALIGLEIPDAPQSMMPGELLVRGGQSGKREVEIRTWLDDLAWRVAYTIVLDGLEADHAWLQGWLAVDSKIAQPVSVERIAIVDGRSSKVAKEPWAQYRTYGQPAVVVKPEQPRVPIALLGRGAKIRGGGSVRLPLFSRQRRTGVKLSRVFDPVGPSLTHQGATPVFRRSYGSASTSDVVPISLSIQLDLPERELARLPAGQVSLFARIDGDVRALGATTGFGQPASQKQDLISGEQAKDEAEEKKDDAPKARPGELRIGVAPGLTGRRWQEDFHLDKARKRIVEEVRVELKNDSIDDATVIVHEHLYRGLNWSLAYHNGVGEAAKVAPQEVRFRVKVPANDKVLVMYRVVYTW